MPSTASNRWDYAPAELGELPEADRPTAREPKPDPTPCPGAEGRPDCGTLVEPRWWPSRFPTSPGTWHAGRLCPVCAQIERDAEARRKIAERVAEAGMPSRYAWADFGRHLKQARGEAWTAFRDRLDEVNAAAVGDGSGPYLGITAWNAPAAAVVRDWRPGLRTKPSPRVIFLTGPVGSGKTTLAAAAAMTVIRDLAANRSGDSAVERFRVRWISSGDLWETLRLEAGAKAQRGALARWAYAEVLVLDDLGTTEGIKAWHRDAMEFLIAHRYNADLPTLITSNLRLDSTDPAEPTIATLYGERVVSRLVEGMGGRRHGPPPGYLELLGMDWRADVPHPQPDPTRPASPSATAATPTPSTAARRQLGIFDWKARQAGDYTHDED